MGSNDEWCVVELSLDMGFVYVYAGTYTGRTETIPVRLSRETLELIGSLELRPGATSMPATLVIAPQ